MKTARPIHKNIRIPNKVFDFINEFEGTTWNDKINNLLEYYMFQDKYYRKHLQDLETEIKEKQNLLEEFKTKIKKFEDLLK